MSGPGRISGSLTNLSVSNNNSSSSSAASSPIDGLIQTIALARTKDSSSSSSSKDVASREQQNQPVTSVQNPIDYKKMMGDVQALLTLSTPMTEERLRQIYEIIFIFAGKTMLTAPSCLICLNKGTIANSHIIPDNILSSFETTLIIAQTPNEPRSAANITWKLFCTPKCEIDRLSKFGENGFALIFHKFIEDVVKARSEGKSASLVTSDQSIHYCIASIIFRYLIINGKKDLQPFIILHGPKVEEAFWRFFFLLRSYVLDKNIPNRPHIELFINEEEIQKNTMITTICTTYPTQPGGCYTTGHFSFKGFHFLIVESSEFMKDYAEDLSLPSQGFSQTITCEPQTIVVKPEHVCTLPNTVMRALKFDFVVYITMLQKVNGAFLAAQNTKSTVPMPRVGLPLHPLMLDPLEFYSQPPIVVRLPDEIIFQKKAGKTGELSFKNSGKFEIVFSGLTPPFQIWFVRNNPAKQLFVIIHIFSSNNNVVYGFSLNQALFKKKDLFGLQKAAESSDEDALKNFLQLTPLSRTDHLGIESLTQSHKNDRFIAYSIKNFWSMDSTK